MALTQIKRKTFFLPLTLFLLACSCGNIDNDSKATEQKKVNQNLPQNCVSYISFNTKKNSSGANSIFFNALLSEELKSLITDRKIAKYIIQTKNLKRKYSFPSWVEKHSDTLRLIFEGLYYNDPQGILQSEQDVIDEFSICTLTLITDKNDSLDIEFCSEPKVKFEMK